MKDKQNREYVNLNSLNPGSKVQVDDGFSCIAGGEIRTVEINEDGELFISCEKGHHYLDGQLTDDYFLIGIYNYD